MGKAQPSQRLQRKRLAFSCRHLRIAAGPGGDEAYSRRGGLSGVSGFEVGADVSARTCDTCRESERWGLATALGCCPGPLLLPQCRQGRQRRKRPRQPLSLVCRMEATPSSSWAVPHRAGRTPSAVDPMYTQARTVFRRGYSQTRVVREASGTCGGGSGSNARRFELSSKCSSLLSVVQLSV